MSKGVPKGMLLIAAQSNLALPDVYNVPTYVLCCMLAFLYTRHNTVPTPTFTQCCNAAIQFPHTECVTSCVGGHVEGEAGDEGLQPAGPHACSCSDARQGCDGRALPSCHAAPESLQDLPLGPVPQPHQELVFDAVPDQHQLNLLCEGPQRQQPLPCLPVAQPHLLAVPEGYLALPCLAASEHLSVACSAKSFSSSTLQRACPMFGTIHHDEHTSQ